MEKPAPDLLTDLLKAVSRSFYLTLRVLPKAVRPQIGLAYLLARTSDTIADTGIVPVEQRLTALRQYRDRILGKGGHALDFGEMARHQGLPAERVLLERCEEALSLLERQEAADKELIREVLATIISGQELDLTRFSGASAERVQSPRTADELDDYTYRVAGCVGEFWTKICRAHLFPNAPIDEAKLLADGIRFGKGLQLVNILRDLPKDLRQGRCYLPEELLEKHGLRSQDLLNPANEPRLRPLYHEYLARAEAHLAAGWDYTNALPRGCARVRLACAWPILIGVQTIGRLHDTNPLHQPDRIRISRKDVRQILLKSVLLYPFSGAWKRLYQRPPLPPMSG